jgi:hypothetical protein
MTGASWQASPRGAYAPGNPASSCWKASHRSSAQSVRCPRHAGPDAMPQTKARMSIWGGRLPEAPCAHVSNARRYGRSSSPAQFRGSWPVFAANVRWSAAGCSGCGHAGRGVNAAWDRATIVQHGTGQLMKVHPPRGCCDESQALARCVIRSGCHLLAGTRLPTCRPSRLRRWLGRLHHDVGGRAPAQPHLFRQR